MEITNESGENVTVTFSNTPYTRKCIKPNETLNLKNIDTGTIILKITNETQCSYDVIVPVDSLVIRKDGIYYKGRRLPVYHAPCLRFNGNRCKIVAIVIIVAAIILVIGIKKSKM